MMKTNHGEICLFYKISSSCTSSAITIVDHNGCLSGICKHVNELGVHFVVVAIYRPGSAPVTAAFLDEFVYIVEHMAVYYTTIIIAEDVKVHFDHVASPMTVAFTHILESAGLTQRVHGPTHHGGHTLDVLITKTETNKAENIEPQDFSDHSLIIGAMDINQHPGHVAKAPLGIFRSGCFSLRVEPDHSSNSPPGHYQAFRSPR